ncbi:YchJ family protein [Rhodoligotrophos defluvii]|uniref:YchJ family protein n=1 Tax=Rhodoligotrophos defluvii TaxID=2561934 RepID=UPI0010C9C537|nr:YchJ family protein [Rhodoligotrophos defluvii]
MIGASEPCPCRSGSTFGACCGPLIAGERAAPTAEALMRSRYSAFAAQAIDYLEQTLLPSTRRDFDRQSVTEWARNSEWTGLEVVATERGGAEDREGVVEFIAHFRVNGEDRTHHETSRFSRRDGRWYYVDGRVGRRQETVVRQTPKIGRNDPCSCGSGKKFKKCCGLAA